MFYSKSILFQFSGINHFEWKYLNKLMKETSYIDDILKKGRESAIAVAEPVLHKTKEIVGFLS